MLILRDVNKNLKTTCLVRYSRNQKGLPQLEFLFQQIQLPSGQKVNNSSRILWLNQLGIVSKYLKTVEKLYLTGQLNDIVRVHLFSSEIANYEIYITSVYNNEQVDLLNLVNQNIEILTLPRYDVIEILINPNSGTFSISKLFAYRNVQQTATPTPFIGLETAFVVQNIQIIPNLSAFIEFLNEYKTIMSLSGYCAMFSNNFQNYSNSQNRGVRNNTINNGDNVVNNNVNTTQINRIPNTTSVNPMFLDNNNY
jgi:hypothetical protein